MKKNLLSMFRFSRLSASIGLLAALLVGCSSLNAPTASTSTEEETGLWTPAPGDEIVAGRPIPIILDENYWETPGITINPRMRPASSVIPVPVDGEIGGTVSCGNHRFVVPTGAVDGIVNFTMSIASTVGIGVDCGPSPMSFTVPVRVYLSYAGTQYDPDFCETSGIEPLDASRLQIWYMAPDGSLELQERGFSFDPETKTISVEVDHFSRYIIA